MGVRRWSPPGEQRDRRAAPRTATCSPPTARSPRPRSSSAASGSSRPPTSTPRSRGRRRASAACMGPVEVRPFQDEPEHGTGRLVAVPVRTTRSSSGSSGTSPDGSSPPWSVSSATSTSPKRRSRRRSSSRRSGGRRPGCRRTRAGGSRRPPATGPSTGCAVRHPAMTATPKPRCSTSATSHPNRSGP